MERPGISRVAVGGGEIDGDGEVHRRSALNVIEERETLLNVEKFDFDDAGVFVAALLLPDGDVVKRSFSVVTDSAAK
jgi:hypothetical protein